MKANKKHITFSCCQEQYLDQQNNKNINSKGFSNQNKWKIFFKSRIKYIESQIRKLLITNYKEVMKIT